MSIFKIFKKRNNYDLNWLLEQVEKEAKKTEATYFTVEVEIGKHRDLGGPEFDSYNIVFKIYINNFSEGFHEGSTVQEALKKLCVETKTLSRITKVPKIKLPKG